MRGHKTCVACGQNNGARAQTCIKCGTSFVKKGTDHGQDTSTSRQRGINPSKGRDQGVANPSRSNGAASEGTQRVQSDDSRRRTIRESSELHDGTAVGLAGAVIQVPAGTGVCPVKPWADDQESIVEWVKMIFQWAKENKTDYSEQAIVWLVGKWWGHASPSYNRVVGIVKGFVRGFTKQEN